MAKNSVTLDIGTNYRGEGFKKLDAALKSSTNATKRATSQWASLHKQAAKSAVGSWTEFRSKMKVITAGVRMAWNGVKLVMSKSFAFETQTQQFKTLLGNIDAAKAHMADLKELGDTPPFSLDQFARASRQMIVMTDGILGMKSSLEMVGDVAAATGNDIESIGHSVSRLYAFIRDGEPIGRAANELRNMGILTPKVVQELKDMQEAGASSVQIWEKVESALDKYKGAMADSEQTGNGLMGAISSRWDNIVRQFGDAFKDVSEGGMRDFLDMLTELENSGFVRGVGQAIARTIGAISSAVGGLVAHLREGASGNLNVWDMMDDKYGNAASAVDDAEWEQVNEYTKQRKYKNAQGQDVVQVVEDLDKKNEYDRRVQREKEKKALEEADKKRAEERSKEASKKVGDIGMNSQIEDMRANGIERRKEMTEQEKAYDKIREERDISRVKFEDSMKKADEKIANAKNADDKRVAEAERDLLVKQNEVREAKFKDDLSAAKKKIEESRFGGGETNPFAEMERNEYEKQVRNDAAEAIAKEEERGAKEQEELNKKLQEAQKAVRDWIDSLENNKHTSFANFNKGQNQAAKDNAVPLLDENGKPILGPDGNPLAIDKKQANQVKSNKQVLDRMLNRYDKDGNGELSEEEMAKMDARSKKEWERRKAFNDMFDPQKLKERMDAETKARKEKEEADKRMRANIKLIREDMERKIGL